MTDADREAGERRGASVAARLREGRIAILAAFVIAAVAVLGFDVPWIAALVGLAVLLVALAWPPSAPGQQPAAAKKASTPYPWPDTGMKLVIEAIADPCFLTDAAGLARFQNRAATDRFGPLRPADPISFKLRAPELLAAVERAGRGETVEPVHFVERVPTERYSVASVTAIRSGADPRRVSDFVMIRIGDETGQIRTERMRVDFIANASHELRTPLAALTGFIETLLGPARNDEANRERFLKIMLEQAQRMARLIDDLLSLSRIEMKAHVQPSAAVDLVPIVGHVVDTLSPLARSEGVELRPSLPGGPAVVPGDRDELIQVTSNLVENAIKYGRRDGVVEVRLTAEEGLDHTPGYTLLVRDDGPGIAPEHLPRLTERFYRVDAEDGRRRKGTGLGLAIVKHIVNRHRGRLAIRSHLGEGTTFTVWLPVPSPADAPPTAQISVTDSTA